MLKDSGPLGNLVSWLHGALQACCPEARPPAGQQFTQGPKVAAALQMRWPAYRAPSCSRTAKPAPIRAIWKGGFRHSSCPQFLPKHVRESLPAACQADLGVHQPPVDKADVQQVKDCHLVCELEAVHIVKSHLQQVKQ